MKTEAEYWLGEITAYEVREKKAHWELWSRHAVGAYSLTTGELRQADTVEADSSKKRYNIFWSNVENLKPGMYSRTPKVVVSRRHTRNSNPVAKVGAEVLERVIAYQLSEHGFGSAMRAARDDYLLVGRGVPWVRYVPHEIAMGAPGEGSENQKTIIDFEEVVLDYVHWSDFGHTDARRWEDVRGVWRRLRMTKEMVRGHWGEEWAEKLAYDADSIRSPTNETEGPSSDSEKQGLATIYEVWDAHKRRVLFVSAGQKEAIKTEAGDPLKLPRFFPCPRPIYATLANDDLFAISDYRQYRTQIRQIQQLTQRIDGLTDVVRLVGVYDANEPAIAKLFQKHDGELIPVTNWAALAAKGGLDGSISFVPYKEIAETLQILHEERDKALQDSYQLTGISDLVRGDTQASETATAQGIKDKYVAMRFQEKKGEIDRCIVNVMNIYGAMICHAFTNETIVKVSGMEMFPTKAEKQACEQLIAAHAQPQQPPQPGMPPPPPLPPVPEGAEQMCELPTWQEVLAFLRDDALRTVLIDIESDSTVAADQQANQAASEKFLATLGGFMKEATEAAQQAPQLIPLLGRVLAWSVRQYPIGRDLEEAVDATVDKMEAHAKQVEQNPPQPPPDPQLIKVQQDGERDKADLALKHDAQQFDQQMRTAEFHASQARDHAAAAHGQALDMAGAHADAVQDSANAERDAQTDITKAGIAADSAETIAHIQNLGKVEAARITADGKADADAEQHEKDAGA